MKKLIVIIWCMMVMNSWALYYGVPVAVEGDNLGGIEISNGDTPFPTNSVYPVDIELRVMPAKYLKVVGSKIVEKTAEEKTFADLAIKYKKLVETTWVEMTAEEKAAVDAAEEVARQAAKPTVLKNAENNFLSLCDLLTASTNHAKLGFAEINALIELLPQEQQVIIGLKLLAVDAEAKREGGLKWWDDCSWHPVTLSMKFGVTTKATKTVMNVVKASPVVAGSYMTSGLTGLSGGILALAAGYALTRLTSKRRTKTTTR